MPPQAIGLAFFIVEEAIKQEPAIASALQSLFSKGIPSPDDWALLRSQVSSKSYHDYVPDSALPASETSS